MKNFIYKILRYSERYTKTDMIYLTKGGFWLTLGQATTTVSSFLLAIAFANFLPKEIYGNYKYIISLFAVLAISNLSGINISLAQSVARGFEGSIKKALKTKLKWSFFGSLAAIAMSVYYLINDNYVLGISLAMAAIFVIFTDNFAIYLSFLQGIKKFDSLTKYGIITKIFSFLATLIVIYLTDNIFLVLLAFFLPPTISHILFYILVNKRYPKNDKIESDTISYGKKLSFISMLNNFANQLDKILIFHYLGAVELAIYAFASAPTEQIKSVLKNIENLALPKFAQSSKEEIKKTIFGKSLKFSLLTSLIIILYILVAPWIYKIFFPQYIEAVIYSQVLALSLITIPIWIFQAAFKSQKMIKQIYTVEIINSISQITLTFLLVANFGLWGAVIARTIYRLINLFISGLAFKKS